MKRLLSLISALTIGFFAGAMDAPMAEIGKKRPAIEELDEMPSSKEERVEMEAIAQPKERRVEQTQKSSLFAGYPAEIEERIRRFLTTERGLGTEKLYNVARNIRTQRLVSKSERDKIDNPEFMDALIRELAKRYTGGDVIKVVLTLHTKAAADWLNAQLLKDEDYATKEFKKLLSQGLIVLLRASQTDAARFLLNAAKVPNEQRYLLNFAVKDDKGINLLVAAAHAGDRYIFDRILPFYVNNINNNEDTGKGFIALTAAIAQGHTQIALSLLQAGVTPVVIDEETGEVYDSALLYAAEANNTEVARRLLTYPNVRENINFTTEQISFLPLEYAAEHNNYPMFKEILAIDDVDLTAEALYDAMRNNTHMVADLRAKGVRVNDGIEIAQGNTYPAFGAFETDETGKPIVDDDTTRERLMLLLPRLRVNKVESEDKSLLMYAVKQAKAKTVQWLLENGAKVNLKDEQDHDALWYAQQLETHNKERIIKLLEDARAKQRQGAL